MLQRVPTGLNLESRSATASFCSCSCHAYGLLVLDLPSHVSFSTESLPALQSRSYHFLLQTYGVPLIKGPFLELSTRIIAYSGLYCGAPNFAKLPYAVILTLYDDASKFLSATPKTKSKQGLGTSKIL